MGLAASQGRLLTITARKADCEFQSMKLSHEKIALSRDMEKISDEYQAAMGKTKLIYDYYGSGTSEMVLSYGLLMTPSVYNDYYPKLLTDNKNRIVLSGPYAAAARAAGIPQEGYNGTPSSEVRNAFVEALRDNQIITASTAANIKSVTYNNAIGLGATFSATQATQEITYADFLDMVKAYSYDTTDYGLEAIFKTNHDNKPEHGPYSTYPDARLLSRGEDYKYGEYNFRITRGNKDGKNSGDAGEDARVTNLNLYDLLTNLHGDNFTLSLETDEGATIPAGEAAFMQQWLVGSENSSSFLNWLTDQFSSILGGVKENDLALQYAYNQVYDLFYPNEEIQELGAICIAANYSDLSEEDTGNFTERITDGGDLKQYQESYKAIATPVEHNYTDVVSDSVRRYAKNYIGGVYSSCGSGSTSAWDGGGGRRQCLAINLNHVVEIFLTAFKEYLEGADNSSYAYNKGEYSNAVLYSGNDDDIFTILSDTDVNDGTDNLVVGFYDAMFNRICTNGWTENDNITNVDYMQELLKNGAVYISSINNDGSYYQSCYNTDTYISEVADTEGIARAEAKYNAAKMKIEHKENTIDMKMKNLDTEISSLTTEYDTMKNVISKTIEKSFKRYES